MPDRNEAFFFKHIITMDTTANYAHIHKIIHNLLADPPVSDSPNDVVIVSYDYAEVPVLITAKWAPKPFPDPFGAVQTAQEWANTKAELSEEGGEDAWRKQSVVVYRNLVQWSGTGNELFRLMPLTAGETDETGNCPCGCAQNAQWMRKAFNVPIPCLEELEGKDQTRYWELEKDTE